VLTFRWPSFYRGWPPALTMGASTLDDGISATSGQFGGARSSSDRNRGFVGR
jgi:hypothetical protein